MDTMNILQDCSNVNNPLLLDEDDFIPLNIIGLLGSGTFSVVYMILLDNTAYAFRVSLVSDTNIQKELNIYCLVDNLKVYTSSLQNVKHFAFFNQNVRSMLQYYWKKYSSEEYMHPMLEREGTYFTVITEIIQGIGYPISLNVEDRIDFIFELLVAIYVLNNNNIAHGDLHPGNIGYIYTDTNRLYRINGKKYLATSKYLPVLFDYGNSYNLDNGRSEIYSILEYHDDIMDVLNDEEKNNTIR